MKKGNEKIKKYTAWHYYFGYIVNFLLRNSIYDVETAVKVGTLPLELDIIIIENKSNNKKKKKKEKDGKLAIVFKQLNKYTIIEFKSPDDRLKPHDFDKLRAYGLLFKIRETINKDSDITIMTISSTISTRYKNNLKANNSELEKIDSGTYIGRNLPFRYVAYALNEIKDEKKNKLLLMFSSKYRGNLSKLFKGDEEDREVAEYVLKHIFKREVKTMQLSVESRKAMEKNISQIHAEIKRSVLEELTAKERLEGLKPEERLEGLKPEERLEGLKPEEVLKKYKPEEVLKKYKPEERLYGLKPEERLDGLNKKDIEKLKKILKNF